MLRRTKQNVLKELPEKTEMVIKCKMSAAQEDVYHKTRSTYHALFKNELQAHGVQKTRFKALEALTKLRQISNHPLTVDPNYLYDSGKLNIALSMLEEILEENHNVLIFSQYVKMLKLFQTELNKRHISHTYLDGSTKDRKNVVDQFQTKDEHNVFLISLKAGGVGLNLTKADYVFLIDPWWNPAVEAQAVERVYRIGQENPVFVYRFITENTVEEKVQALQEKKKLMINEVISDEMSTFSKLDEKALLYLFE